MLRNIVALCLLMAGPLSAGESDFFVQVMVLHSEDAAARQKAAAQLKAAGAEAIPALAAALKPKPSPSDTPTGTFGSRWGRDENFPTDVDGLVKVLDEEKMTARSRRALFELKKHGKDAKPALPKLLNLLPKSKGDNTSSILAVLEVIGPDAKEALPEIKARLKMPPVPDEDESKKYYREAEGRDAAYALASIAPDDEDAGIAAKCLLAELMMKDSEKFGAHERARDAMLKLGAPAANVLIDAILKTNAAK